MLNPPKLANQVKHINYLQCDIQGHQTEPLSRLCIDKDCNHKTLICSICQQENHKKHQTMPLKTYLLKLYGHENDIKNITNNQNYNPLYYVDKISDIKKTFINHIAQFRIQVNQTLDNLESKAQIYFNQLYQKILLLIKLQNPLDIIKKQGLTQFKLKKYFQHMVNQVKIKQKFSMPDKLRSLYNRSLEKQKQLTTGLSKIKTQLAAFISKVQKNLDPKSVNAIQKVKFSWSEELKGTKMKIMGPIAQQTGMESSGQRFIMLQPSLTDSCDTKLTWAIKVIKFVGWIGIGICLKNIIQKANFYFNYNTIGHGSYMISNNGYSWSHSATQFNSAHKTFHFANGDIVYCEYDKINKKLKFHKNLGAQKFQLDVVDPPAGDSYYPCANICSTGDSVQVINPESL